jgi:hypothetical protein
VQITAALNRFGKDRDQDKLDWLREQIEMRTIGLGWTQFKGQWSSSADEDIGSVEELRGHLKSILEEEDDRRENGELPSKTGDPKEHCPAPQLQRKSFRSLGTPTVQADALSDEFTELEPEELLAAAEKRKAEVARCPCSHASSPNPAKYVITVDQPCLASFAARGKW